jgi:hypothetical protein
MVGCETKYYAQMVMTVLRFKLLRRVAQVNGLIEDFRCWYLSKLEAYGRRNCGTRGGQRFFLQIQIVWNKGPRENKSISLMSPRVGFSRELGDPADKRTRADGGTAEYTQWTRSRSNSCTGPKRKRG